MVREIENPQILKEMMSGKGTKVIKFYTDWCSDCKAQSEAGFDKLATGWEKWGISVLTHKVQNNEKQFITPEHKKFRSKFIKGHPLLVIVHDGIVIHQSLEDTTADKLGEFEFKLKTVLGRKK